MKILFIWTGVTSYMADCWRKLAVAPGVELKVIIDTSSSLAKSVAFKTDEVMKGIDWSEECRVMSDEWKPDIVFAVGWRSKLVRHYVELPEWREVPKVCCFDMPWRWQLRCLVAPIFLRRFLRNYRAAYVPGAVCAKYAKWLGFKQIYKGLFAIDTGKFKGTSGTARYFLYIGRDSSEKRLGDIRAAHALYKARGGKLELKMYGKGLEGGFVSPEEVPALMQNAAAFVLASEFDPWPLVLLEAMSAGCPVIASNKCTNWPELGKNWHVFKVGDVKALAKAMEESEACREESEDLRRDNFELVREYDCSAWVSRVLKIAEEVK